MSEFYIVHYCHSQCVLLNSITELPEKEAFKMAEILGKNNGESFYRFKDFIHYYPRRIKAEKWLYEWFLESGGKPETKHPLYFVLDRSDFLNEWFDKGKIIKIPLSIIESKHISFTIGDSMATFKDDFDGIRKEPLLKIELQKIIEDYNGNIDEFKKEKGIKYIECQLWDKSYLNDIIKIDD